VAAGPGEGVLLTAKTRDSIQLPYALGAPHPFKETRYKTIRKGQPREFATRQWACLCESTSRTYSRLAVGQLALKEGANCCTTSLTQDARKNNDHADTKKRRK
jgi:hypothetical protein